MKTTTIVAVILGVLVLISAVQAFQLSGLKTKMAEEQVTVSSAETGTKPLATSGEGERQVESLPKSIKELPQMVGGC